MKFNHLLPRHLAEGSLHRNRQMHRWKPYAGQRDRW